MCERHKETLQKWMSQMRNGLLLLILTGCVSQSVFGSENNGWWPRQLPAQTYVEVPWPAGEAERFMLVSLSGLAAQGVNDGRHQELVWIQHGGPVCTERWKEAVVKQLSMHCAGRLDVWQLLERYQQNGLVKGYIPFQPDTAAEGAFAQRETINPSANLATVLAALHQGVLAHPALVERLKQCGLKPLADPSAVTPETLRAQNAEKLSSEIMGIQDPKVPQLRDFLIAQRAWVGYGLGNDMEVALQSMPALTPVAGWNMGDEFKQTSLVSQWGHMKLATNWKLNLPFLMSAGVQGQTQPIMPLDPKTVDLSDSRPAVSFLLSDGDNVAFLTDGVWAASDSERDRAACPFWDNPLHGQFPIGFSACLGDLVDVAPMVLEHLAKTKPPRTSLVQFGGGYFYPDHFARNLPDREQILRRQARLIGQQMRRTGATILCFLTEKSDSPAAQQAMQIYAEEIHPLLGMMVMDYAPYHRMDGYCYWFGDGQGGQVPALTARYSLWANLKLWRTGDPWQIAKDIAVDAASAGKPDPAGKQIVPRFSWVAVHVWSRFPSPQAKPDLMGVSAVSACVENLNPKQVNVVSPEELFYRLRHEHGLK